MKEPKTNRGKRAAIIRQADKINAQLLQLQAKAQQLSENCRELGADFDNLAQVAADLACFDFEDAIPELPGTGYNKKY